MGTATSSPLKLVAALAAALTIVGCGGAARSVLHDGPERPPAAFAWLHPAPAPTGWKVARLNSQTGALAYPDGWRAIRTDPGTVSVALLGSHGRIRGYLNTTPRQGAETLANWQHFRPAHNREEGARAVVRESAAAGLRFRSGYGSCVIDRYATETARYREIACLVRGSKATTVVVAAAPPAEWARLEPMLERSIASFSN
jgi:hypothetical protein